MVDNEIWEDEAYEEGNYVMLFLKIDSDSVTLKGYVKKGIGGQSNTIWAKRKGSKWLVDFGAGDEEYEDGELPNPMKRLIDSGGAEKDSVRMPPISHLIKDKKFPRKYIDYLMIAGMWEKTDRKYIVLSKHLFEDMQNAYLINIGVRR